jgi:hypothetical protein
MVVLKKHEHDHDQNLNEFLDKNLNSQRTSVQTRAYRCLKLFAKPKRTVKNLLENTDSLRNYGQKAHNWTKLRFEQLGFEVDKYPFFQKKF